MWLRPTPLAPVQEDERGMGDECPPREAFPVLEKGRGESQEPCGRSKRRTPLQRKELWQRERVGMEQDELAKEIPSLLGH